jgi:hypothetical protein
MTNLFLMTFIWKDIQFEWPHEQFAGNVEGPFTRPCTEVLRKPTRLLSHKWRLKFLSLPWLQVTVRHILVPQ